MQCELIETGNFGVYAACTRRPLKGVNVAQADRFQEGMKKAYGKPVGVAARVKRGKSILVAEVEKEHVETAKEALKRAGDKFPVPCRIVVTDN